MFPARRTRTRMTAARSLASVGLIAVGLAVGAVVTANRHQALRPLSRHDSSGSALPVRRTARASHRETSSWVGDIAMSTQLGLPTGGHTGNPRAIAHAMIRAGAAVILGSGPHVIRGPPGHPVAGRKADGSRLGVDHPGWGPAET